MYPTHPSTFGLEQKLAKTFERLSATPNSARQNGVFSRRPPCEPILTKFWSPLSRWKISDELCDALVAELLGGPATRREGQSRSLPNRDGRRTIFLDPAEAVNWTERLRHLNTLSLNNFTFAASVFATTVLYHPYVDGNGRIGRALFQAALASRGVISVPVIPLGPASYHNAAVLVSAIRELGCNHSWASFFAVVSHLVDQTIGNHEATKIVCGHSTIHPMSEGDSPDRGIGYASSTTAASRHCG